jgi:RND family efflux transporter MFP subunit
MMILIIAVISAVGIGSILTLSGKKLDAKTQAISAENMQDQIVADGTVGSDSEATLHFQTAGKVVYLPFKEGDTVSKGQTIAQLDTTIVQKQLAQALNTYRSTRDTFDQTHINQDKGVVQNQQKTVTGQSDTDYLNDVAKRIVDQNQANLDNSVLNVEIANYALQLSSITSPLNGTLVHSDITVSNVNVTPTTSFTIADLNSLIFKANVRETDIPSISEGSSVTIRLSGLDNKPLTGTVVKVYPDKTKLPTGENAYRVDIQSADLAQYAKYGQSGTVLIESNSTGSVVLAPSWVVLDNKYVWVRKNGQDEMRTVKVGKTISDQTQIISGLQSGDEIITDPEVIASKKYKVL